ncbi:MAG TPA: VOC family protein [Burkholderiales bacterium]|nr:VOC family protein [Burkholderiales bacterium]
MKVESYLFFEGRTEEALEFYKQAIGAEVQMLMRYKDSPEPPKEGCTPPNSGDKVMHSSFRVGETLVMASDGMCSGKPDFKGFALSLSPGTDAEAQTLFSALSQGGQVMQPLIKTFFASSFGMVTDKFGVMWMVIVESSGK